jgi:HNH endonuclease
VKEIPLTRGYTAIVDDSDYDWLNQYKWCTLLSARHSAYAVRRSFGNFILMHRLIIQPEKGFEVHHVDGRGWNNQRNNLEIVTRGIHIRLNDLRKNKTSKYRGVRIVRSKYVEARITAPDGKQIRLGYYPTELEAALAYNEASLRLLGPGYPLNVLE